MNFKSLFCILCFLLSKLVFSSHIVGGEITLLYKSGETYNLSLHLYYDAIDGNQGAQDGVAYISLFDKATNLLLDTIDLPLTEQKILPRDEGICSFITYQTNKFVYSKDIILKSTKYDGNQGFYASWDRCCRNGSIINIFDPGNSGSLFYAEFPPVSKRNSSPVFKTPTKTIYGCVGIPQKYDFSVIDNDNDQIIYSIEVPLNGNLDSQKPFGRSIAGPYNNVNLVSIYKKNNLIASSTPIILNSLTGILSFTPTILGVFAIRVKASTYRSSIYLGEVNRDYQIIVANCYGFNTKPNIQLINPITNQFTRTSQSINYYASKNFCLTFIGLDTIKGQTMRLSLYSNNVNLYPKDYTIEPESYILKSTNDTAIFKFCIYGCNKLLPKILDIDFELTNENNCSKPLSTKMNTRLNSIINYENPIISTNIIKEYNDFAFVNNSLIFDVNIKSKNSNWIKVSTKTNSQLQTFDTVNFINSDLNINHKVTCNELNSNPISYKIVAIDSNCFAKTSDSLTVKIKIIDSTFSTSFFTPNIITPNNDGKNDVFEILKLPQNNCIELFDKIEIYNRWGTRIFENNNRNFSWNAINSPNGLYFYIIYYTTEKFNGWIQVVR